MLTRIFLILLTAAATLSWHTGLAAAESPKPQIVKQVKPVYPPEARQAGIQGKVELEAVVTKDGKVSSLQVLQGEASLAEAAVAAVRQWEYQPVILNGEPVDVVTRITLNFVLAK